MSRTFDTIDPSPFFHKSTIFEQEGHYGLSNGSEHVGIDCLVSCGACGMIDRGRWRF